MSTLHSLTRRIEKLEATTRARYAPPDWAVIFYDVDNPDEDQINADIARAVEQGVSTLFYMPRKETLEENAARYPVAGAKEQLLERLKRRQETTGNDSQY